MAAILDRIARTAAWVAAIPLFAPDRLVPLGGRGLTPVTAASVSDADAAFAVEAARSGMAEVLLSELAQDRAERDTVLSFASRMVADHTTANAELIRIGLAKRIALPLGPAPADEAFRDHLDTLPADEFEAAYLDRMEQDHAKAVQLFAHQRDTGRDVDLTAFAARMHAMVSDHLAAVRTIIGKSSKKGRRKST